MLKDLKKQETLFLRFPQSSKQNLNQYEVTNYLYFIRHSPAVTLTFGQASTANDVTKNGASNSRESPTYDTSHITSPDTRHT